MFPGMFGQEPHLAARRLLEMGSANSKCVTSLQDPQFHQNAYALLTAVVLSRSIYVMEFSLRPSLSKKEEEFKLLRKRSMSSNEKEVLRTDDRRDAQILKAMWIMISTGLSIFLGGFLVWSIDNKYCSTLRIWRRQIGLPWGILLEGHGWWSVYSIPKVSTTS